MQKGNDDSKGRVKKYLPLTKLEQVIHKKRGNLGNKMDFTKK